MPGERREPGRAEAATATTHGQPAGQGPFPAVLVIHENRGLNPYIEDVARRVAVEGFVALAPDGLSPVGGYPGNDDDGRTLQAGLDQAKLRTDMLNGARFLKTDALSTGKLGVIGFFLAATVIVPAVGAYALGVAFSLDLGVIRDTHHLLWGGILYGLWTVAESGRIANGAVILIMFAVIVFLVGLVSEQISAMRFESRQ